MLTGGPAAPGAAFGAGAMVPITHILAASGHAVHRRPIATRSPGSVAGRGNEVADQCDDSVEEAAEAEFE